MRRLFFIAILLLGLSGRAFAGPWSRAEGEVYSRLALSAEDHSGLTAVRADFYVEYGLSTDWTLVAKLDEIHFEEAGADYDSRSWRIGIRRGLLSRDGLVGAVEGALLKEPSTRVERLCRRPGLEIRAALGWSGQIGGDDGFALAEVAAQSRGGCHLERAELGVGQNIGGNMWVVSQVWRVQGARGIRSDKVQTELMWRHDWGDLAFGFQQELGEQVSEAAILVSIARRF